MEIIVYSNEMMLTSFALYDQYRLT